jgi:hypothetical protein
MEQVRNPVDFVVEMTHFACPVEGSVEADSPETRVI